MRLKILVPLMALSACVAPVAEKAPVAQLDDLGQTYPIYEHDHNGPVWRIKYGFENVQCSAPTVDACKWSLRQYIQAQDALDDYKP